MRAESGYGMSVGRTQATEGEGFVRQHATGFPIKYASLASVALGGLLLTAVRTACDEIADRLGTDGLDRFVDHYVREGWNLEAAFDLASADTATRTTTRSPQPRTDSHWPTTDVAASSHAAIRRRPLTHEVGSAPPRKVPVGTGTG